MQVYLLRHGIAEEGGPGQSDAERELTPEGRRKLRETLRTATRAEVKPTLILSSPLVRALQTAEIARDILHAREEILRTKALVPSSTPEQVWEEICVHKDENELMLVGHDPLFTSLAAYLLGAPDLQIDFKKGALMRVDFENFGPNPRGVLRWFLISKLAAETARRSHRPARAKH
jgi:phosphohistidine phosphatase